MAEIPITEQEMADYPGLHYRTLKEMVEILTPAEKEEVHKAMVAAGFRDTGDVYEMLKEIETRARRLNRRNA